MQIRALVEKIRKKQKGLHLLPGGVMVVMVMGDSSLSPYEGLGRGPGAAGRDVLIEAAAQPPSVVTLLCALWPVCELGRLWWHRSPRALWDMCWALRPDWFQRH